MKRLGSASECICRVPKADLCRSAFVLAAHQTIEGRIDPEAASNSPEATEKVLDTNLELAGCRLTTEQIAARLGGVVDAMIQDRELPVGSDD